MKSVFGIWLCFFAASLFAADELDIARQALRDGLYDVAREHAAEVDSLDAKLIELESYASENRWDDIKAALEKLGPEVDAPALRYYRAVVAGDIPRAIAALGEGGSAAGLAEAKMLEADLKLKADDRSGAERLWREVTAITNAGDHAYIYSRLNLNEAKLLDEAYNRVTSSALKGLIGIRLGCKLLEADNTFERGEKLIRAIVQDNPGVEGAGDGFLKLASAEAFKAQFPQAIKDYQAAFDIWPELAQNAAARLGLGDALFGALRFEEALENFTLAEKFAKDHSLKAGAILRQGEVLSELGRGEESMAKLRLVLEQYPTTEVAEKIRNNVQIRELESQGRERYRAYRFEEAMKIFEDVAKKDPARKDRMAYFQVLCRYGMGQDDAAVKAAESLTDDKVSLAVRADASLWLAKFMYNRDDWKSAIKYFRQYAAFPNAGSAQALAWAAKAALTDNDCVQAIALATEVIDKYPTSPSVVMALLVQGEALIESARYDEAVLILEKVPLTPSVSTEDRLRAKILYSDAFFAMGADNAVRYETALEGYRSLAFDAQIGPSDALAVAFKIGRVLEKLKRYDEAIDQYYTKVVLAYRSGCERGVNYDDNARSAFIRAAFRLADEFERSGRDQQAINVLRLVVFSNVSASDEADKRITRILTKGRFL